MFDKISQEEVIGLSTKWEQLEAEVSKVVFGQNHVVSKISMGLLANGHILLEGVPGLAKTTLVKTIAKCVGLKFSRIQFTPDLLPSDVVGTVVFNPKENDFYTRKGPIFAGVVLADEINRAPAKVQSALLEAMEEHQVTIGSETFFLEKPLIVLATQNPIDQEGTYSLPEAQMDRFMFKILLSYPDFEAERNMLISKFETPVINQILNKDDILESQLAVKRIFIDEKVVKYILDIVAASRGGPNNLRFGKNIKYGASPRASIALCIAAKARAFLNKRTFVTPEDVKAVALDILRHRLMLTYEAEVDGFKIESIVKSILDTIQSP
jgi:MoxR-like ATPase